MKKKSAQLNLHRETLRTLDRQIAEVAQGGALRITAFCTSTVAITCLDC